MAKGRDKITRRLQIEEYIQNYIKANFIGIGSTLRYDGTQVIADPNDIPPLGYIQGLIGLGTTQDLEYSGDQVTDNSGNPYLQLALTGTQRPFSILVNGEVITTGPFNIANNLLYSMFKPDGSAWTVDDVIMVGVFGVAGEPIETPIITVQPISKTVVRSREVMLSVTATNATGYQWSRNGIAISGATSSNLSLPNMTSGMAGDYTVFVYNSSGNVTSSIATITYDAGIQLINFSHYAHSFAANGTGRVITFVDGPHTESINVGYGGYISTTATSIIIRQNGSDNLTLRNDLDSPVYKPILGGNVDNNFSSPFAISSLSVFNDNGFFSTELELINTTDRSINYSINSGSEEVLLVGDSLGINSGDYIEMSLQSTSVFQNSLTNQSMLIMGQDGSYEINTVPRRFDIPSGSTSISILSSLD